MLPLGSTEQHGSHLPFATDTWLADALAARFCERVAEAIALPALAYGCASEHLAFGYGVHICLGAPLARLEAKIAINTILRRMPHLQLATDAVEWENTLLRGLKTLPLSYSTSVTG